MKGKTISLVPLLPEHRELLRLNAKDDQVWRFNTQISKYSDDLFNTWFTLAYNNTLAGSEKCFAIEKEGKLIGSSRYYSIKPDQKEISIGFTWIAPAFWGTSVNPEMKYLLLKNAFENGFERVFFHVDSLNVHSLNAMKKLGAVISQVSPKNRMRVDGTLRDTVEFVVEKKVWTQIASTLQERIKKL